MDFEHTLLLFLFFLPLAYKIAFWQEIFFQETSFLKKLSFGYAHFLSYIELPLFLLSLSVYYNIDLEIFFFNFFLYFFGLVHIFLLGKIFRRQKAFGRTKYVNITVSMCICILLFMIADSFTGLFLYAAMSGSYLGLPFFFLLSSQKFLGKK